MMLEMRRNSDHFTTKKNYQQISFKEMNFFHSESEDMLIFGFCLRVSSGAGVVVSVVERLILG